MESTDESVRLGSRPEAAAGRDLFTLGALLFAPVLLIVLLSFFGEAFGWVVGITLGWMLGLALLWSSRSWTSAEKGLATLVWPGGLAPALLLVTMTGEGAPGQPAGSRSAPGSRCRSGSASRR